MDGNNKRKKVVSGTLFLLLLLFAFNLAAAPERPVRLAPSVLQAGEAICNTVAGILESMPFPIGYALCDLQDRSPLLKEAESHDESAALPVLPLLNFLALPVLLAMGFSAAAAIRGRMNYLRQIFSPLIPVRAGPFTISSADFASAR